MKKIFIVFIVTLFTFIVPVSADGNIVLNEDFESFRTGESPEENWSYDTNDKSLGIYAEVTQDPTNPKNKVFKYIRSTGDIVYAKRFFKPSGGNVTIEYKFMIDNTPDAVLYVGLVPGVYNLMTYKNGYEFSGGIPNLPPEPNIWHTFKININFLEKNYNAFIDNNQVRTNQPLLDMDIDSIDQIQFVHGTGFVLIDDLKVTEEGGIVKNYTKLLTDKYYYNSQIPGIYNVPIDTTPEEFLNNITFVKGAITEIYEKDGISPYKKRFLEDFAILRVQSPDYTQKWDVTINMRPWKAGIYTIKTTYDCAVLFGESCDVLWKNKLNYIDPENPNIACFQKDGELYVPLRRIAELYGKNVGYNSETNTVTIDDKKVLKQTEIVSGRTFIKASDMAELIGKKLLINDNEIVVFGESNVTIDDKSMAVFKDELLMRKKGAEK